jgi:VanZ family protein
VKGKFSYQLGLWLPVILWAVLIFHFSSGAIPVASPVYWQDFTIKKTGHVLLFGFLAVLIFRALRGEGIPRKKAAIWAVLITFFYGATDEYHQMFTQGREARVRDVFIDGIGASIFIFLTYQFLPKLPKKIKIYAERLNLI